MSSYHEPMTHNGRAIEARRDDEHGFDRPWVALVEGQVLRNRVGALRTFGSMKAALAAARRASNG